LATSSEIMIQKRMKRLVDIHFMYISMMKTRENEYQVNPCRPSLEFMQKERRLDKESAEIKKDLNILAITEFIICMECDDIFWKSTGLRKDFRKCELHKQYEPIQLHRSLPKKEDETSSEQSRQEVSEGLMNEIRKSTKDQT